ncbi:MAG TPA: endonuclease/exonuclease/phosphatase family protein [Candidatus Obscuribacterales bacterium]
MRIATWNLERADPEDEEQNAARLEKIREINADIWILTETHECIDLSGSHHGAATAPSPRKPREGEACAAVWSRWPILNQVQTADSTEAVCVEIDHPDRPLLVYGSIIAYHGYKGPDGNSPQWEQHYRYIQWHGEDWKRLRKDYPNHKLIAGGDYNQNRDGAKWYGTNKGRDMLSEALESADLVCVTEEDLVKSGKLKKRHSVDHICLDKVLSESVSAVLAWENESEDGVRYSDHNGLLVELA